jgi:hypothetical protein
MKRSEHSLQIAVVHMLRLVLDPDETWFSSIDHGVGKLGMAEAGLRKKRGVKPGLPDIILMARIPTAMPRSSSFVDEIKVSLMFGIELKADKGRLSESQIALHWAWKRMGFEVYVARSLEDVQKILDDHAIPCRRRMNLFAKGVTYERAV